MTRVLRHVGALAVLALATTARGELVTPGCDWPIQVAPGAVNVFYPDSIASYWVMPFRVQSGLRIVVSGVFGDARYSSFNVYTNHPQNGSPFTAGGVGSSLADHRIVPDAGSVNPWQQEAAPGGRFTVTLRDGVVPGEPNALPLAPPGTPDDNPGWLIYRIYLPAGGATGADYNDFSRIALPRVTFQRDGESREVPPCRATPASVTAADLEVVARLAAGERADVADAAATAERAAVAPPERADTLPGENWFFRPPNEEFVGGFPNADSAYVGATPVIPPAEREVVVLRGKAPRQPPGLHPSPWPVPGRWDVRYWSMCTYTFFSLGPNGEQQLTFPLVTNRLPDGTVDYGCRHDDITALDANGFYTYVVGTESQRARIERVPGATYLPFSTDLPTSPHSIYFRNMLPDDAFRQGCQFVPYERNPDAAAAIMGAYYPKSRVCSLATLVREGAEACLRDGGTACAFSASEEVVLGSRVRSIDADVFATGEAGRVRLGSRVRLGAGTLVAAPAVTLGSGSAVFDVDATTLDRRRGAVVDGVSGSAAPPVVACTVPALACDPAAADVVVARGDALPPLPPGTHGTLRVEGRGRLVLAPGRHVFCALELGRAASLVVAGTGATTIDVAGAVRFAKGARLESEGDGVPVPRLRAGGAAPSIRLGPGVRVRAHLVTPEGEIDVGGRAELTGSACGRRVRADRRTTLRCAPPA